MQDDLKARKEAFVTGHEGSPHPWEVLWVCSSVLWGSWLYAEFCLRITMPKSSPAVLLAAEALLLWFPIILAQTHYLYPYASLAMVGQILIAGILWTRRRRTNNRNRETNDSSEDSTTQPPPQPSQHNPQEQPLVYLTLYRSSIYFLTFVAILAVDFPLFPRRFCKTEESGYGLMDVGAASFVISSGIVSGKSYTTQSQSTTNHSRSSLTKPLVKAAPLILIGLVRCVANKELEYQEHVSEYGVHWNFFFTLGVLAVLPTIRKQILLTNQLPAIVKRWVVWAPLLALVLYQYELTAGRNDPHGLRSFVLTAPRTPELDCRHAKLLARLSCGWMRFFYANREGILGCIGYTALHAAGEWVGQTYVFRPTTNSSSSPPSSSPSSRSSSLGRLTLGSWMALYAMTSVVPTLTVSRRETNLPFCLWAMAHNLTILWGCQLVTTTVAEQRQTQSPTQFTATPIVGMAFGAVNRHGMISFLVANLLTGCINVVVPTIDQPNGIAMAILIVYLFAVGGAALGLDSYYHGAAKIKNN